MATAFIYIFSFHLRFHECEHLIIISRFYCFSLIKMPLNYVKKNALHQYLPEVMEKAYTMVTIDGAPFSTAARACGVACTSGAMHHA